ncbi:MAG: DUF433 domain-containing protein [Promethearchaeota archaeon]
MIKLGKYVSIIRDPEVCGGAPVIKGIRVLVMDILDWIKKEKTLRKFFKIFPPYPERI